MTTAGSSALVSGEAKSLENDEWEVFVDSTLQDAISNPEMLLNANLLAIVVAPLRNVNASASLVEKIATLLAVPWSQPEQATEQTLIRTYADTRVVANLLYACKVIVQRRSATNRSSGSVKIKLIVIVMINKMNHVK